MDISLQKCGAVPRVSTESCERTQLPHERLGDPEKTAFRDKQLGTPSGRPRAVCINSLSSTAMDIRVCSFSKSMISHCFRVCYSYSLKVRVSQVDTPLISNGSQRDCAASRPLASNTPICSSEAPITLSMCMMPVYNVLSPVPSASGAHCLTRSVSSEIPKRKDIDSIFFFHIIEWSF